MSVVAPLCKARELLGLDETSARDPAALKRAYRDAARRSPPDRDPDGFALVRRAYDTLRQPVETQRDRVISPIPLIELPRPAAAPQVARGATALSLLRVLAGTVSASELLDESDP